MKRVKNLAAVSLAVLAFVSAMPAVVHAATTTPVAAPAVTTSRSPSAVVKAFYAQLTDTMKQGDQLGFNGRFKKLQPVIMSSFDMPLMTRVAVGLPWSKATPDEQKQLVSAFSDFSVANYASRFTKYNGEKFDVIDEKPATGGGVIVETELTPKEGDPVKLNYLMKADDKGQYHIVDVLLAGSISELANRRSEFNSIVERDGIPALVNSLGDKTKQMGPS